jgi:hypothetical protein
MGESTGPFETGAAQKFWLPRCAMTTHGDLEGDGWRDCVRSNSEIDRSLAVGRQWGPVDMSKERVIDRQTYVYSHDSLVLGFPHLVQLRKPFILRFCSLKGVQGFHQYLLYTWISAIS